MTPKTQDYLECCLYFTANSLARVVARMADEEFGKLGLCSSHAFLLMLAADAPGISQKELAEHLNLAQSTVSRFVDSLAQRGYLEKRAAGKLAQIHATESGKAQLEAIHDAWQALYGRVNDILGQTANDRLAKSTCAAYRKLAAAEG
jgi:MarR family transcriptional regulator, organic hydroperoxide resistance regulator